MPRRSVGLQQGYYYHVYNRGVDRGPIFFEPENYSFFLRRLRQFIADGTAEIIAYCLMPNHYHMLVHVCTDGFSALMQRLGMSYANAINKRYRRIGPLFQGRFQAKVVAKDEYLLHLSRYIHLNPVRAGLVTKAEEWPYSSYADFIGLGERTLVQPGIILEQLTREGSPPEDARRTYKRFVEGWSGADDRLAPMLFEE